MSTSPPIGMWRGRMIVLALSWVIAISPSQGLAQAPDSIPAADGVVPMPYQVGVGRVDVTPSYPVRLNGFGSRRDEPSGKSQTLWGKALAISCGADPPILILTLDNLGVRESLVRDLAERLEREFGIPREHVCLTFTHTHCAPKVNGASDTIFSTAIPPDHQLHIDQYTRELPDLLMVAARQAIESRRPARLDWAVGKVGFAVNRRTAGGPVDHDLPVLFVRDAEGQLIAVYTTYACHCVTLSFNQYSGDWAGYAQELIERDHPGTVAMVSIGCGSDSNPSSGVTGDAVAAAAEQGQQIAQAVNELLLGDRRELSGSLSAQLAHLSLPLQSLPSKADLQSIAQQGGPAGFNASWQLERLQRGEPLVDALDYPIQTIRFGDQLQMIFLAGEVCVDYALRLKRELNPDRIWVHGYSNDFCAYIPSERLLREGGYGGGGEIPYFALPAPLAPGLEEKIVQAVLSQTPADFVLEPGTQGVPPRSPEDALAAMQTHSDLVVELVAAEPLVADPVAIDFGRDGSLWVAEMPDYGRGVTDSFPPQGRVKNLRDSDRNGRFDRAIVFLDGLRFPTDVKIWRDGLLICDAPDILFAADRDGDGRAEVREVLLSGFATHNPHARVNSLRFGLDGWIYGSGGLFGGQVKNRAGQSFAVSHRDFRWNPDTGQVEGATGQTQQGRTRDDFDNWFGCNNSQLLQHYGLDESYVRRHPQLPPPRLVFDVPGPDHGQQLFPPSQLVLFQLSGPPGRPTSACGAEIFRARNWGPDYYGNAFVCEPVNQSVHRMQLDRDGYTFVGRRAANESNREFLSSPDQWFRPVQARTGPDGALYVVDMYRYVIEHSQWIPPQAQQELNIFAGQQLGRIYRILPRSEAPTALPDFSEGSDVEIAARLADPNGVVRDMAQQILIWRDARSEEVGERLREMAASAHSPEVLASVLATRHALGCLERAGLENCLNSTDPELRRLGLRFAELHVADWPKLWTLIAKRLSDEEPAVRLQAILLLRDWTTPAAAISLAQVIGNSPPDSLEYYAALSGLSARNAILVWEHFLRSSSVEQYAERGGRILQLIAPWLDALGRIRLLRVIRDKASNTENEPSWKESLVFARATADWLEAVARIDDREIAGFYRGSSDLAALAETAARALLDPETSDSEFLHAVRFLQTVSSSRAENWKVALRLDSGDTWPPLIDLRRSPEVQLASIRLVLQGNDTPQIRQLIEQWSHWTPPLRGELLGRLMEREDWIELLLGAIERGVLVSADLDLGTRQRLLTLDSTALKTRAEQALATRLESNRVALVDAWRPALELAGEFERGRRVFGQHCASCHRLDGIGTEIGPDLAALTQRTPPALLVAILDPNRDVDSRYLAYTALTRDGLTLTGVLAGETAASVILKERGDKQHTISRADLEDLQATRKSAMPEGIEKDLQPQDLADLFAYLGPPRFPRRHFEGNQPEIIQSEAEGQFVCRASQAEIYGEQIVFESGSPFQNLGYWSGMRDQAIWELEVPLAGDFDVYLDFACSPDSAGNPLRIAGHIQELVWTVPSTGSWSEYRWEKIGLLKLAPGRNRISGGFGAPPSTQALIDLRQMVLVPAGKDWPRDSVPNEK